METELTEAQDGAEAIKILKHNAFDLLILDIKMPIVDGLETLEWVRNNNDTKDLPVIMLTGESSPRTSMQDETKGRRSISPNPSTQRMWRSS